MTKTPLTDFLATLADPLALDHFRADPRSVVEHAKLPVELADLVLQGHPGAIRVHAVKELEAAGLSPLISQYFISGAAQQPMNISMNSYTSSTYTSNTSTSNTYTTNTTDYTTTTSDTTTTTTHNGFPGDFSLIDVIDQAIL
jgi:hypothetical protein